MNCTASRDTYGLRVCSSSRRSGFDELSRVVNGMSQNTLTPVSSEVVSSLKWCFHDNNVPCFSCVTKYKCCFMYMFFLIKSWTRSLGDTRRCCLSSYISYVCKYRITCKYMTHTFMLENSVIFYELLDLFSNRRQFCLDRHYASVKRREIEGSYDHCTSIHPFGPRHRNITANHLCFLLILWSFSSVFSFSVRPCKSRHADNCWRPKACWLNCSLLLINTKVHTVSNHLCNSATFATAVAIENVARLLSFHTRHATCDMRPPF